MFYAAIFHQQSYGNGILLYNTGTLWNFILLSLMIYFIKISFKKNRALLVHGS